MEKQIFELLTELERDAQDELCTNADVSVQKSIGNESGLLKFLRSDFMCDAYQFRFLLGEKNWTRERRAHKNFMLVTVDKPF